MSGSLGTLDFPRLDIQPEANPLSDYADQIARLRSFTDDHFASGGAPQGPVVAGPSLAQGVSAGVGSIEDYIAAQRADAAKRGLWDEATGLPTGAGVVDAGRQYAQGLLMGTTAPGAKAVPGQGSLFDHLQDPTPAPAANALAAAPKPGAASATMDLPGGASVPVRPASEDIHDTIASNFNYGRDVGPATVPLDSLSGGASLGNPKESARVDALRAQIAGPDGYMSRPIVDTQGNVIEGQHRIEAARALGVTDMPVHVVQDLGAGVDEPALHAAIKGAQPMKSDNVHQIAQMALEAVADEGSAAAVRAGYDPPAGYDKAWDAALTHIEASAPPPPAPEPPNVLQAYHGSPHLFAPTEDNPLGAFRLDKMGTGEGAQAYGWGSYLAENEGIARSYRDQLSGGGEPIFDFGEGGPGKVPQSLALDATRDYLGNHPDLEHVSEETLGGASEFVTDALGDGHTVAQVRAMIDDPKGRGAWEDEDEHGDWQRAAHEALNFAGDAEVTPAGPLVGGKRYDRTQPAHVAAEALSRLGDPEKAAQEMDEAAENASASSMGARQNGAMASGPNVYDTRVKAYQASADMLRSDPDSIPLYKAPGHLYQAEVHGSPDDFLHWDHPFSAQSPQVQEALGQLGITPHPLNPDPAGAGLYQSLARKLAPPEPDVSGGNGWASVVGGPVGHGGHANASQALADAGIKGIRYIDATSRGKVVTPQMIANAADDIEWHQAQLSPRLRNPLDAGERAQMVSGLAAAKQRHADLLARQNEPGTHNFVVFNPQTIRIIRRYGIAGLMGGGAAALGEGGSAQQ